MSAGRKHALGRMATSLTTGKAADEEGAALPGLASGSSLYEQLQANDARAREVLQRELEGPRKEPSADECTRWQGSG